MDLSSFAEEIKIGSLVLDCRSKEEFENGFIPGAIFLGNNPDLVTNATLLFEKDRRIILVATKTEADRFLKLLQDAGFSNIGGYLEGGFENWNDHKRIDLVIGISGEEFVLDQQWSENVVVIDVRNETEWTGGVAPKALLIPFDEIQEKIPELKKDQEYQIYSNEGYRSLIAASIFKKNGFQLVKHVSGGLNDIKAFGFELMVP